MSPAPYQPSLKLISKPVVKPITKPITKPAPKPMPKPISQKISAQELKTLQEEAVSNIKAAALQNQINAENQAKYLTERDQYIALLSQVVRTHWINQYQDQNLQVSLKIQQDLQGNVMEVGVVQSSGNEAFDRSAIMAVQKSSPLPLPPDGNLLNDTRQMTLAFS